ncbi:hypothetical protein D3C78_1679680 [compost metagenome]
MAQATQGFTGLVPVHEFGLGRRRQVGDADHAFLGQHLNQVIEYPDHFQVTLLELFEAVLHSRIGKPGLDFMIVGLQGFRGLGVGGGFHAYQQALRIALHVKH